MSSTSASGGLADTGAPFFTAFGGDVDMLLVYNLFVKLIIIIIIILRN